MKKCALVALCVFLIQNILFCQNIDLGFQGNTYAVVIGISDYQNSQIQDLKFADKDAIAFADFLRSPGGGKLDSDHLKLLTNNQATSANVSSALYWLIEKCKENDQAIIYFSGHGDVENKLRGQPGFLLCWDSPAKVYMGGGSIQIGMIQSIIETLSLDIKAKVTIITDACRSGKLAGNSIGGSQLTNANLAKQYANEIKILSCQPNEYSIEGEQWGGGRGAFSYHLVEGLMGMADNNADLSVNLMELGRYLEDRVASEVAPLSQIPMTVGARSSQLTNVDPEYLGQLIKGKKGQLLSFNEISSRGIEELIIEKADTSIKKLYYAFNKSIEDQRFLAPENDCTEYYYLQLLNESSLMDIHTSFRRKYAVSLQDDIQQVINNWLDTDIQEIKISIPDQRAKYKPYPRYLERVIELLGKEHYMYATLKSLKLFFEGFLMYIDDFRPNPELGNRVLEKIREAADWNPDSPLVYELMMEIHLIHMAQEDSVAYYAEKTYELAPSWILPYSILGSLYGNKNLALYNLEKSGYYLELVDSIDSTASKYNIRHINNKANYYYQIGQYNKAEALYMQALQLDSTVAITYNNIGLINAKLKRYDQAEYYLQKGIEKFPKRPFLYLNLGNILLDSRQYLKAEKQYIRFIDLFPNMIYGYNSLGWLYLQMGEYAKSEMNFNKYINLNSTTADVCIGLGLVYAKTNRNEDAEKMLQKGLNLNKNEAKNVYAAYAVLHSLQNQIDKAFESLEKAFQEGYKYGNMTVDLEMDPALSLLRKSTKRWDSLIDIYFPEND